MKPASCTRFLALPLRCVFVIFLSAPNASAFVPPVVSTTASVSLRPASQTTRLAADKLDGYDLGDLQDSDWERGRLNNMYAKFGSDEWLVHRASDRFYGSVLQFGASPIVKNLLDEAAVLVAICLAIIVWNGAIFEGYSGLDGVHVPPPLADKLPRWIDVKLALPTEPFFLCGGPLGLLLVFRNDVAFGRYREAILHWEVVTSALSNVMLMAANCSKDQAVVRDIGLATWTLGRTLQHELSGPRADSSAAYEEDVRHRHAAAPSSRRDLARLFGARNKLFRAQYDIHAAVEVLSDGGEITNLDKRTMINNVNAVAVACAECERLFTTPIPLLYTKHTLKFLSLWMTLMPLAFYDIFKTSWNHIFMIPSICIICFLFFGIEEIAVSLEEPFSILPMDEFVEELALNTEDAVEWMPERSLRGHADGN